ncbi:hypothetical protein [Actinoplanes nipponensis]|uniref:hypothetical protein n=1 Tax=Actinoplanes nipponensis TaxID=135950 RepID=UPI003F68CC51
MRESTRAARSYSPAERTIRCTACRASRTRGTSASPTCAAASTTGPSSSSAAVANSSSPRRRRRRGRRPTPAHRTIKASRPVRAPIQAAAAATVSTASSQCGSAPTCSPARAATTAAAASATACCTARCRPRRADSRIRTPATAMAASCTARAGTNPQASTMPKVKQMDGRITELARRLATT